MSVLEFQFTQVHFMTKDGRKHNLYYKRISKDSAEVKEGESLYKIMSSNSSISNSSKSPSKSPLDFPFPRSLLVISFDKSIQEENVKQIFRFLGKLRYIEKGVSKKKGEKSFTFFILVFKFEKDLKKAFDREFFQNVIHEKMKGKLRGVQRSEEYLNEVLIDSSVMKEEGPVIDEDGFVAIEEDEIQEEKERFVTRKRKKKEPIKQDFYKFQVSKERARNFENLDLEEDGVEATRKRIKLEFERDIAKLQEIRENKFQS